MEVIEVKDKQTEKQFLKVPHALYSKDLNWICPPENDIRNIFDPKKNKAFEQGEARRWVLLEKNKVKGRIAAFYQQKDMGKEAGIGFFECIDDKNASAQLFDIAVEWLREQGVKEVQGAVNFGQRDAYWGLLVDGFSSPAYQDNYHLPYYQNLFKAYGWQKDFEQQTAMIRQEDFNVQRLEPIAKKVMSNAAYTFKPFNKGDISGMARDFTSIYNRAWQSHEHFNPVQEAAIFKMMQQMKPLVEERLISLAYVDQLPAGFFVSIRDINPLIREFKGKFGWVQKLRLLLKLKTTPVKKLRAIVFGVVPEHQNKGLETGMIWHFYEGTRLYPQLEEVELSWIGDFNPKMLRLLEAIGSKPYKTHITFRLKISD